MSPRFSDGRDGQRLQYSTGRREPWSVTETTQMQGTGSRAELFEEYYKLASIVQSYDSYCLTIKAWGVTVSGAALGIAFSRESRMAISMVALVACALSVAFWLTEVRFKLFQLGHMLRVAELEDALQHGTPVDAPRIFAAFGEQTRKNLSAKRWRSVAFWPQVMLPHIVFASLSLTLIIVEIASQFASPFH